jgi:CRISPR-associated endonuclease/helicase Cas3
MLNYSAHMPNQEYIRHFWGKAQPADDKGPSWHPAAYHMLDVGAVAEALLMTRPLTLKRAAAFLGLSAEETLALLTLAAALHDLGKFARAFQMKVPKWWGEAGEKTGNLDCSRRHWDDGWMLWDDPEGLGDELVPLIWPKAQETLDALMNASLAHHGRPCDDGKNVGLDIGDLFGPGEAAARAFARDTVALLLPHPLAAMPPKAIMPKTFWFSGFVTLADWVGSNQANFRYHAPNLTLTEYWDYARTQAAKAVKEAGLNEATPALAQNFVELTKFETLTPMQQWAQNVPLPEGPSLFVIEDVTGAGKTEAAEMLVHRLMAAGRATGAYWAMPTQATANAMYDRQKDMISALFSPDAHPRLVLAHGQAKLSDRFRESIVDPNRQDERYGGGEETETATASCTAFLAEDKRAAMVADVGAGTVDQALLAALPVKFNTVRLFGLAGKVLIFDEAHAYDPYVQAEIEALLRFQASLGGCAIILSATLPFALRQKYANAWHGTNVVLREAKAYPLATIVASAATIETAVAAAEQSRRTVPARLVHEENDALEAIVTAAKKGAACTWIRNTVDDVLAAAESLSGRGIEPIIFHARFAQCDRQAREREVMALFGKDSTPDARRGKVLVASQVVEQSLDLDFDLMVSDLAPVDLLIQRAGRLWRHKRPRPPDLAMELIVLSPKPVEEPKEDWIKAILPGTAAVYRNANVLWRTARILAQTGAIVSPEGLRDLIEDVYDKSAEVPTALERATAKAEGDAAAERGTAQWTVLKPKEGYRAVAPWLDERKVTTRLIDNRIVIRLGRMENGVIIPYATDKEERKAWALSEIQVPLNRIPEDAAPPPHLAAAAETARAHWGRYEQDMPLIVLEPAKDGNFSGSFVFPQTGRQCTVIYNKRFGFDKIT